MTKEFSIPLGRIFNIPIGLDYSWFLIFIIFTWALAVNYFPSAIPNWSTLQYWLAAALTTFLFFLGVLLHELGHSIVALRYHIPVKRIRLLIFGGVSEITTEPTSALSEFWIAISGPLVSLALGLAFELASLVLPGGSPARIIAGYLAGINVLLGIFNLIPGYPLDGGQVLRAIIWGISHNNRRANLITAYVGRFIAYLLILLGVWWMFQGNLIDGLWIAFIGWFMESAASTQIQQQSIRDLLGGHTVSQAMTVNYSVLPPDITLQELADEHILGEGRRFFIIKEGENFTGVLSLRDVKKIPREAWQSTLTRQAMIPVEQVNVVHPETGLWDALEKMDHNGVNQLPVTSDQGLAGILSRENIIGFLRTLQEMR